MSQETSQWLNTWTLVGFTEKRGNAWHYRASEQGERSNHYTGAIPMADVRERIFNWEALEGDLSTTALTNDGVLTIKDPTRKTMIRPPFVLGDDDQGGVLGVFKSGYQRHTWDEWLLRNVENILDDEVSIASAGLLRSGAVGWVTVEVPDSFTTPEGVEFRPFLNAATSLDGSLATTVNRSVQLSVCDNTLSVALGEASQRVKVRHSRYSHFRLQEARDALGIIHRIADDFSAQVAELCAVKVSEGDWAKFLDSIAPVPHKEDENASTRGATLAANKRDALDTLYKHDDRVAPWTGTAFGVVQAVNTYEHHVKPVRGKGRVERNMERAVTGGVDVLDRKTLELLGV